MESVFASYQQELERSSEKREDIKKEVEAVTSVAREIEFLLQKLHTNAATRESMMAVCATVESKFDGLSALWARVAAATGTSEGDIERYRDVRRFPIQLLVCLAAFVHFIQDGTLADKDEVARTIGFDECKIGLDVEEYLHGVCQLPKELCRLCVNCVSAGNYSDPPRIFDFLSNLYNGFKLLNLKNDQLRRKFDGIKYSVQKVEEVLYDIRIRKLGKGDEE